MSIIETVAHAIQWSMDTSWDATQRVWDRDARGIRKILVAIPLLIYWIPFMMVIGVLGGTWMLFAWLFLPRDEYKKLSDSL